MLKNKMIMSFRLIQTSVKFRSIQILDIKKKCNLNIVDKTKFQILGFYAIKLGLMRWNGGSIGSKLLLKHLIKPHIFMLTSYNYDKS